MTKANVFYEFLSVIERLGFKTTPRKGKSMFDFDCYGEQKTESHDNDGDVLENIKTLEFNIYFNNDTDCIEFTTYYFQHDIPYYKKFSMNMEQYMTIINVDETEIVVKSICDDFYQFKTNTKECFWK